MVIIMGGEESKEEGEEERKEKEEEGKGRRGGRDGPGSAYPLTFKGYLEDKNLKIYAA